MSERANHAPRDVIISAIRDAIETSDNAAHGGTAFEDEARTKYSYVDIGELDLGAIADRILGPASSSAPLPLDMDGWAYDFTHAPRSRERSIIVILKDRKMAWIRYHFSSPVLEVFWDEDPDSEGWTTGGCDRLRDEELECWRAMPDPVDRRQLGAMISFDELAPLEYALRSETPVLSNEIRDLLRLARSGLLAVRDDSIPRRRRIAYLIERTLGMPHSGPIAATSSEPGAS